MKKLLIYNFSRSKEICDKLALLEIEKKELQAELDVLQEKCEHPIIIVGWTNNGYAVRAKCLFCNEYYTTPHEIREIPNSILLEAWTYTKFKHIYSDEEIYSIMTSKAKEFIKEYPNITSKQLAKKLENYFNK